MAIDLGAQFEQELLVLAGLNVDQIDPGTAQIALVNTAGPTTVRATIVVSVDTPSLKALIQKYTD